MSGHYITLTVSDSAPVVSDDAIQAVAYIETTLSVVPLEVLEIYAKELIKVVHGVASNLEESV